MFARLNCKTSFPVYLEFLFALYGLLQKRVGL
jgi:hypothetical protein